MGLEDIGLVGGTKGSPKKRITQEEDRVYTPSGRPEGKGGGSEGWLFRGVVEFFFFSRIQLTYGTEKYC